MAPLAPLERLSRPARRAAVTAAAAALLVSGRWCRRRRGPARALPLRHRLRRRGLPADPDLEGCDSFEELYAAGLRLAERSRTDGSAALLSHLIGAAHTDPAMAEATGVTLGLWHSAVAGAVRRILAARGLDRGVDVEATTGALAAATIGMITLDAVPGSPLGATLPAIGGLPGLLDRALRLLPAPLARRIVRGRE